MRFLIASLIALALLACGTADASADTSGPTAYAEQADLLLQRVDALTGDIPAGKYPIGAAPNGKLYFVPGSDWNSGFWAGALWRAADLKNTASASDTALQATIDHFGFETTKLHDLGFMYGESSVAAFEHRCRELSLEQQTCSRLQRSGITAAGTLVKLAGTTGQGIIPMSAKQCSDCSRGGTETIVDSMMNLPLLYWASKQTGSSKFRTLARRHADWVAKNLERSDGSTYQAGSYKRSAKRPTVRRHTHQGKSNSGVWSRGQAWSIYGFADAAKEFKSRKYLAVAEKNAAYVAKHLPADAVPKWDYRAGNAAPKDVSAGVITAAGLFHLVAACSAISGGCADTQRWDTLARRILTGSLAGIRTSAPIGYLGGMAYNLRNKIAWDDDAELTYGLDYALEAIKLARES
ncbi:MAG: glycoside hydrolase family 88 protein [Solirubrobacterales bacterium]